MDAPDPKLGDVEAALTAGMQLGEVKRVGETPYAVVPAGAKIEVLDRLLATPLRAKGYVELLDLASFIAYVGAQKGDHTRVYADAGERSCQVVAVFNDHGKSPGWCDYRAEYKCPWSVPWAAWKAASGKQMPQEEFARFIEDRLPEIATPPAADMLEISRSLEAKKSVDFASAIRLANGAHELRYEEKIEGSAAKGMLRVPEEFTIGVPVFYGGPAYAVRCRLRYRIQGAKLTMGYELVRPDLVVEDAFRSIVAEVAERTGLAVLIGRA
jgi:uncharacterized protein YfdQ (DUF2303 family)